MAKKLLQSLFIFFVFIVTPTTQLLASEITIRPFLIDEVLEPRGTVTRTISLTSAYPHRKAIIYPTVNEITLDNNGEIKQFVSPIMSDRTNTVTSWVQISRNRVAILPGETVEVPLTLKIHPNAVPGEYHLFIGFVEAPNKPTAQAVALAGDADGVIVKVTVSDQRSDTMRIGAFLIDRFITGDNREIQIEIENSGEIDSAPTGEIIFYNSSGIEVASTPVNTEGVIVQAGETTILTTTVPVDDSLGRFKANLSLRYGEKQQASLYDSSQFYMMSYQLLLIVFGGICIITLLVAFLFRRAFTNRFDDEESGDDVAMFVRDGHNTEPKDHDINLKNKN